MARPAGTARAASSPTRIYVVGHMHGSETAWRKFVNSVALNAFKVDVALLVGALGVDGSDAERWHALKRERLADVPIPLYEPPAAGVTEVDDLPAGLWRVACAADAAPDALRDPRSDRALRRCILQTATPATDAIAAGQPLLAVHPAAGSDDAKTFIGDTLCLTIGSTADADGLSGFVVDIGPRGIAVAQAVRA